jgi:hypothetical protein
VLIRTSSFSGRGSITANGGAGSTWAYYYGGGGAGGRIAIYYYNNAFTGSLLARGGVYAPFNAGPGNFYHSTEVCN